MQQRCKRAKASSSDEFSTTSHEDTETGEWAAARLRRRPGKLTAEAEHAVSGWGCSRGWKRLPVTRWEDSQSQWAWCSILPDVSRASHLRPRLHKCKWVWITWKSFKKWILRQQARVEPEPVLSKDSHMMIKCSDSAGHSLGSHALNKGWQW